MVTYVKPFFERLNWILFLNVMTICKFEIRWKQTIVQTWKQSIHKAKHLSIQKLYVLVDTMYIFSENGSLALLFICTIYIYIYIYIFFFELGRLRSQTYKSQIWRLISTLASIICLLDNLETSTLSVIFYVFYSNFSLRENLENAVSEHLEQVKFQKFSRGCADPLVVCSPDPPVVSQTVYSSAKIMCSWIKV